MAFKKAERVTDVTFVIDDGTARIECSRWLDFLENYLKEL